jgi:predicted NBD/HSP70 family sugar kinase
MAFFAIGPGRLRLAGAFRTHAHAHPLQRHEHRAAHQQTVSTTIAAVFLPAVGQHGYSTMFFIFAGCTVVYFITAAFFLPETKGKTLEEIEEYFEGDCEIMEKSYGGKFQVIATTAGKVPASKEMQIAAGGHLKGCRIGFDLGASDYKVSAVVNGQTVFTEETPWDPKTQANPEYHYHHISAALHRAAAHLPRVDAIGGSSAGIIVDNEIRVASLLRAIPRKDFPQAAKIFKRIQEEWNVPLVVMNDGDVTALAGALSLQKKGMLGIAMGSSEAAGFMDKKGRILGWLNELAFAPVDYNPAAAADEWSGDHGVGALYFSQQAVNRLLPAAGIDLPKEMGQPERLKEVQALMLKGDERAAKIYETIGIYLGYTIPHYADFYDYRHMLILGRVTTGKGGDIVLEKAREVLGNEFAEAAAKIQIHVPDEKARRVGQAVAAASLPVTKK